MRSDARHFPLRKIIHSNGEFDDLECGHTIRVGQDIYGVRPSGARRRCRKCWLAMSEERRAAVIQAAKEKRAKRQAGEMKQWQQSVKRPAHVSKWW